MTLVLPSFPGSSDGLIHSAMTKGQAEEQVVEGSQAGLGSPVKEGKKKFWALQSKKAYSNIPSSKNSEATEKDVRMSSAVLRIYLIWK